MVFRSSVNGHVFGIIRNLQYDIVAESFIESLFTPFAEDECGNIFSVSEKGEIFWWDHETGDLTRLASSFSEFCEHCSEPEDVMYDENQVQSAWIDPKFLIWENQ